MTVTSAPTQLEGTIEVGSGGWAEGAKLFVPQCGGRPRLIAFTLLIAGQEFPPRIRPQTRPRNKIGSNSMPVAASRLHPQIRNCRRAETGALSK